MEGQMHLGVPGHMMQGQAPLSQKPLDQQAPLSTSQLSPPRQVIQAVQMTAVQMNAVQMPSVQMPAVQMPAVQMPAVQVPVQNRPVPIGGPVAGSYGHLDNLTTYCAPSVDYVQRNHSNQPPCHSVGRSYYGPPMYHAQQMIVNQPLPLASPPSGQHQSLYFRPGLASGGAYPRMQGSSHWGEYRVRMDQVQIYGGQQCTNQSLYINPTLVDQFGSPVGASSLESNRFGSPSHGYSAGQGYYNTHVQQYPPYIVPGKAANIAWHSVDHGGQRAMDQKPKQVVHPVNVAEAGFQRLPSAMPSSLPTGAGNLTQNYIPGKRLEHFSPGGKSCGTLMMSPTRQNAECLDEFSNMKMQSGVHGLSLSGELSNRQCQMYGPGTSPGSQFRQGVPQRDIDAGGMHQGAYISAVYGGPQTFGDARCHFPSSQQLHSPNCYQYTSTKCDVENTSQVFNPGSNIAINSSNVMNFLQNQVFRETAVPKNHVSADASEAAAVSSHSLSHFVVTAAGDVSIPVASTSVARCSDSLLMPLLEKPTGLLLTQSNLTTAKSVDFNEQEKCLSQSSSLSAPISSLALSSAEPIRVIDTTNDSAGCSVSSMATGLVPFTVESASNKETVLQTSVVTGSEVEKFETVANIVKDETVSSSASNNLSCQTRSSTTSAVAPAVSCSIIVTQTASTSTTFAMTTSTAMLTAKQCWLTTAAAEVPSKYESVSNDYCRSDRSILASSVSCIQEKNVGMMCRDTSSVRQSDTPCSAIPSSLKEMETSAVKADLTLCLRRRVPRAKKKRIKVKDICGNLLPSSCVQEFPNPEANLTSVKLEESDDAISDKIESCSDSTNIKPALDSLSKEPCLDESALKNCDLHMSNNLPVSAPLACLQKVEAMDVKDQHAKSSVTVPFGWKRKISRGRIVYLSPTETELDSLERVQQYLLTEGTCKCGLSCPLIVEKVFSFDPDVESRHLCADDVRCDLDMTNLCDHKRKIVAMANFQHSAGLQLNLMDQMHCKTPASVPASLPPLLSSDGGFESRGEFSYAWTSGGNTSSGLLVTACRKFQDGGLGGTAAGLSVGHSLGRFDTPNTAGECFHGLDTASRWPALTNPGGTSHSAKVALRMEPSRVVGSSSYVLGNCTSQTDRHGDQNVDFSNNGFPHKNQSLSSFAGESPGYHTPVHGCSAVLEGFVHPAGHQHRFSAHGPSRPAWPSLEENRFQMSHCGRSGGFGLPFQPKLRPDENFWTCRPVMQSPRFRQNRASSYGSYTTPREEQTDPLGVHDMDNQVAFGVGEPWGQAAYLPGPTKPIRKGRKKANRKEKPYSSILEKSMPCPNIDVRQIIQDQEERLLVESTANATNQHSSGHSVDNLTTFMAQQTVLVNKTFPGSLGCTSPADDSDLTRSASATCSSADDVIGCQTFSGPLPLGDSSSSAVMPSNLSQKDLVNNDVLENQAELKSLSNSAEISLNSNCYSSISSSSEQMSVSPSSVIESIAVTVITTGEISQAAVQSLSHCAMRLNSGLSLGPELQCSISSSGPKGWLPSTGAPLDRLLPNDTMSPHPTSLSESNGINLIGLAMRSHLPPSLPYNSHSMLGSLTTSWHNSNAVHSRNPYHFQTSAERGGISFPCSASGVANVSMMSFCQPASSCAGQSEYKSSVSDVSDGVVSDNSGTLQPGMQPPSGPCHSGMNQISEGFTHFPDDSLVSGNRSQGIVASQNPSFMEEQHPVSLPDKESPITLVQNMVSDLVTTQNTLAMVTSMIISRPQTSRRRKSSSCSDPSRASVPSHCVAAVGPVDGPSSNGDAVISMGNSDYQITSASTGSPTSAMSTANSETENQNAIDVSVTDVSVLQNFPRQSAPVTAVTNVTQVVPSAAIQPSFGQPLHVPPIVQVLNPLNIALPGTSILLNDQVLAFGGQDPTILQPGLAMPGVGQLHIAPHPSQGQMVVFPSGQGTTMVALQPTQSTMVTEFPIEEDSHVGGEGNHTEGEVGGAEEGDELEQAETDDMMRTTGTQTSTPTSSFSNSNSLDSGENDLENPEILCPDQSVSSSTKEEAVVIVKDSCSKRMSRKVTTQPAVGGILQQGALSTAQVVVMPSVQQQPFMLPQGVAFAGALGGQGYLHLQQPVDFGFSQNQVGLIHFGQITAAGGLIPTQALVGTMSVAGGGVVSTLAPLDRIVAQDVQVANQNLPSKPDIGTQPAFGPAEILHLMSPGVPQGHILVQNMPTFAPFAGAIVPVVPQAALGTAICNIAGAQTIFAVSQGSLGIVTSVAPAVPQHPVNDRIFGDAIHEAPDSTVDSEEPDATNAMDSDSVVTSTEVRPTALISADVCSSRNQVMLSVSNELHTAAVVDARREDEPQTSRKENVETPKDSSELNSETRCKSLSTVQQQQLQLQQQDPDDGVTQDSLNDDPHIQPGPSYCFASEPLNNASGMKLVRRRKKKRLKYKRRRHVAPFSGCSEGFLPLLSSSELKDTMEMPVECVSEARSESALNSADVRVHQNDDNFSSGKLENPTKCVFASTSAECPVTTSLACDSGDSLVCHTARPRASRLRTKMERVRGKQLNVSNCRLPAKRSFEDDVPKDEHKQDADDADSTTSLPSISYPRSFNMGDLVWGPIRGCPSWPGKLVPETEVRGNPKTENGKIWVKWFGDHTYTQAEPDQLKTLSEGLETHHNARKKHRKGRRMNAKLEAAIQEAMMELDRQTVTQSKQKLSTIPAPDKSTPARQWGSRRTKK